MLKNIGVPTASITLVVESCWILVARRHTSFCNVTVISTELDPSIAHPAFINLGECSGVYYYLLVPTASIAVIIGVLGIKCPLHSCKGQITLNLVWMKHVLIAL